MNVTLTIDQDLCIGYGECVGEDPAVVELDAAGCARLRVSEVDEERARKLCEVCPVGAISVTRSAA